ncbi:MAG: translation initiation factor Sui1 [Cellvibrionales bacterium]|nr:translation initiation factor Sui1 [Cellvibrionales bacterium]
MPKKSNSRLVYSTETGNICPDCGEPKHVGKCKDTQIKGDGRVRISRETKGRKGAGVTLITGLALTPDALKVLHKKLKKRCGVGGAVKDGVLEFQGDHRTLLLELLEKEGITAKLSGG